jgi:hypothetical protein
MLMLLLRVLEMALNVFQLRNLLALSNNSRLELVDIILSRSFEQVLLRLVGFFTVDRCGRYIIGIVLGARSWIERLLLLLDLRLSVGDLLVKCVVL